MSKASIATSAIVGVLIFSAVVFSYYQTSGQFASLSTQNAALQSQNSALQNQNVALQNSLNQGQSALQQQINGLAQQVSTLEQRTVQIVTQTNTVISVVTSVSTTSVTSTYTSTVYPIPDNVTVYVVASGQFMNYAIAAGSYSASGSLGNSQSFHVTPVFQGETITVSITLSCPGSTGPTGAAYLYLNGSLVSHASVACGGTASGQISYVL